MGLAVYHPTFCNEVPDLLAVANQQSVCWLTPSALNGRRRRTQEPALALATVRWGQNWGRFRHLHAGSCARCYDLNPTTSSPFASAHSLPRKYLYAEAAGPKSNVKAHTATALVWSPGLPLWPMLVAFISPMEVLSIERISVHLYFLSWRVPSQDESQLVDCAKKAVDGGGRLPRQGLLTGPPL
jgi:hypothetical protein